MPRWAGQAAVQALCHGIRVKVATGTGKLSSKPGSFEIRENLSQIVISWPLIPQHYLMFLRILQFYVILLPIYLSADFHNAQLGLCSCDNLCALLNIPKEGLKMTALPTV